MFSSVSFRRIPAFLALCGISACNGCKDEPAESAAPAAEEEAPWTLVGVQPTAALMSVGGRSASDVYAVGADDGSGGLILHYDGNSWTRSANTDLHDLWWVLPMDGVTFAAGAGGTVLQDTGAGFSRMETPGLGAQTIYGIWGASSSDMWAVGGFAGRSGFLWHYDGTSWTVQDLPEDLPADAEGNAPALFKVWGRAANDVYAAVARVCQQEF